MLNKKLVIDTLSGMSEMVGKPISEAMYKIYYEALKDMTDEQFSDAAARIIKTRKFTSLPMPADFLEDVTATGDALAIEAWQKITNTMARVGAYETIIADDPLICGFIQGQEGGWPGICAKTLDELIWIRKEFERYYKAIKPENITCKPLIGISEGQNMKDGQEHAQVPYYMGDKAKGQALIEHGAKLQAQLKELEG